LLDNADQKYVLRVRDMPEEDKPREKLVKHGPGVLTTAELLAVLLNTGTKKEEVLTMTARIIKEYGEMSIMSENNAERLAAHLDIPAGKAAQIIACVELGRRFFMKNSVNAPVVRTPREVYEYVKDMGQFTKEHLRGIYLNTHYKIIHDEVIAIGTIDANITHPREVFRPALEYSAAAVILVHNHPSGSLAPSHADITITEQLISSGLLLGIDLVDHIIITKDAFASIPAAYRKEP
jgi:DNA repair protein RadC